MLERLLARVNYLLLVLGHWETESDTLPAAAAAAATTGLTSPPAG